MFIGETGFFFDIKDLHEVEAPENPVFEFETPNIEFEIPELPEVTLPIFHLETESVPAFEIDITREKIEAYQRKAQAEIEAYQAQVDYYSKYCELQAYLLNIKAKAWADSLRGPVEDSGNTQE